MEHLGQAYEDANRLLAEAGVLPDLRNVMKREANARTERTTTRAAGSHGCAATGPGGARRSAGGQGEARRQAGVGSAWEAVRRWAAVMAARRQPSASSGATIHVLQQLLAAQPVMAAARHGAGYRRFGRDRHGGAVRGSGRTRSSPRRN